MENQILKVENLRKKYGHMVAVDDISFEVKSGEVFGLLGPNGAGKTTTLECIEGLRRPNSGTISVAGLDPLRDGKELRRVLGVQLQTSALPENMLVGEAVSLVSAWLGMDYRQDLVERFGLESFIKKEYGTLSTGQKRRVQLALSLVGNPKILILDEPTAGVDVQGRAELHKAIRELREMGVTILLATHDMAEAESLCDRLAILLRGKIVTLGTPEQVTAAGSSQTKVTIRTRKGSLTRQGKVELARFVRETEGFAHWFCQDTAAAVMELLAVAMEEDDTVEDLRVERPSLEERFLEIVKGGTNQ